MPSFRYAAGMVAVSLVLAGCGSGASSSNDAPLETEDEIASYGVGLNVGRSLQAAEGRLQMDAFLRGVEDAMAGSDPAVAQEELQSALQAFSTSIQEEERTRRAAAAEENARKGDAYREENAAKEGVTVTESGLQYEVLEEGDGPTPGPDDRVRVHYRGTLVDGTEFDSSYDGDPATFTVGGVIDGFSEGLQLMPVGSKYRFVIPPELAYGDQGNGRAIGPNETLVFELELLGIE